ncbi:MAG: hypothetical protein MUO85_07105 [candidate division Zixibacteria bacterium]|nr:hypothetical protein [candidate division Zixibacteria bacterium]
MERDNGIVNQLRRLAWLRYNLIPLPYWYGKEFRKNRAFLEKSQWWSPERIKEYQWGKLKNLLEHAYKNVPFYQERFKKMGLHPNDIRSFEDFSRIPVLTKADLKDNLGKLKAKDFERWQPIETNTGGTTGSPVKLYRSQNSETFRKAVVWRWQNWAGYFYGDRRIGDRHRFDLNKKRESWYEEYEDRQLTIDSCHLNELSFKLFVDGFRWYKPKIIYNGNLSFLKLLARYVLNENIEDIKPKAILTLGEALSEFDRKFFESTFGCKVFDYYGMRENAVSAYQCEEGNYHMNSEMVLMEFEKDGKPAPAGQMAKIIGTNLHNYAFPLIRYNTEDIGYGIDQRCPCGRNLPLMKIVGGRSRDFLVTKNGLVTVSHQMPQILGRSLKIDAIQFHQEESNSVVVKIVPRDGYAKEDESFLIGLLNQLFEDELKIDVEYVEEIPRTPLGKYRFVISEIPVEL